MPTPDEIEAATYAIMTHDPVIPPGCKEWYASLANAALEAAERVRAKSAATIPIGVNDRYVYPWKEEP